VLKVIHLGKFYPPAKGGMETILERLCERTSLQVANKVLVANTSRTRSEERVRGVDIVRVPTMIKIGAVAVCPTLPLCLSREQADVIVIHEPNPMALVAYFLARPKAPLIVWFHSEVIRPSWKYRLFYRPFLRFALSRASRVVVASPTLAASAAQLAEWRPKCVVIPYGVETPHARPTGTITRRSEAIRRRHRLPIVLFVGRLVPYKGVDVLIEAMRDVPAVALVVGDGPERRALEQKAKALQLEDRIVFLGEVDGDELSALYDACELLVLPSVTRQEAFGVVQIEAMACGKPVISTALGTGVAWVNQHRETGLVVPPRDASALRGAIGELLSDSSLRDTMGAAGARRARSTFAVDRMIDLTLDVYRSVVSHDVERKTVA
jgi:glycosyltransferase involved in cell wall biosynthesis